MNSTTLSETARDMPVRVITPAGTDQGMGVKIFTVEKSASLDNYKLSGPSFYIFSEDVTSEILNSILQYYAEHLWQDLSYWVTNIIFISSPTES